MLSTFSQCRQFCLSLRGFRLGLLLGLIGVIAACTPTAQTSESELTDNPSSSVAEAAAGSGSEEAKTPPLAVTTSEENASQPENPADNSPSDELSDQSAPAVDECDNPQTQLDMNLCSGQAYKRADATLNQTYKRVQSQLSDSGKQSLTSAELAWIDFRDLECDFARDQFAGGSIAPLIYSSCLESYTEQRTTELQDLQLPQLSYEAADAQLNQAYQQLLAQLSEERSRDFVSSQLAWIEYRDRNCAFEVLYGTEPIEESQCLSRMSETRTTQILATLEQNSL